MVVERKEEEVAADLTRVANALGKLSSDNQVITRRLDQERYYRHLALLVAIPFAIFIVLAIIAGSIVVLQNRHNQDATRALVLGCLFPPAHSISGHPTCYEKLTVQQRAALNDLYRAFDGDVRTRDQQLLDAIRGNRSQLPTETPTIVIIPRSTTGTTMVIGGNSPPTTTEVITTPNTTPPQTTTTAPPPTSTTTTTSCVVRVLHICV